jgi:hypothetical protein
MSKTSLISSKHDPKCKEKYNGNYDKIDRSEKPKAINPNIPMNQQVECDEFALMIAGCAEKNIHD